MSCKFENRRVAWPCCVACPCLCCFFFSAKNESIDYMFSCFNLTFELLFGVNYFPFRVVDAFIAFEILRQCFHVFVHMLSLELFSYIKDVFSLEHNVRPVRRGHWCLCSLLPWNNTGSNISIGINQLCLVHLDTVEDCRFVAQEL